MIPRNEPSLAPVFKLARRASDEPFRWGAGLCSCVGFDVHILTLYACPLCDDLLSDSRKMNVRFWPGSHLMT
jgi:hypothetical protein